MSNASSQWPTARLCLVHRALSRLWRLSRFFLWRRRQPSHGGRCPISPGASTSIPCPSTARISSEGEYRMLHTLGLAGNAERRWRVHFILNSKGGVGKSFIGNVIVQRELARGRPIRCFDG